MNIIKQLFYIIGVVIVLYIIVEFIIFPYYTRHDVEIELADISEMSLEEARKILNSDEIKIIVSEFRI